MNLAHVVNSCGHISRMLHAMDMRLAALDTTKTEVCMWKHCDNHVRFGAMSPCTQPLCVNFGLHGRIRVVISPEPYIQPMDIDTTKMDVYEHYYVEIV